MSRKSDRENLMKMIYEMGMNDDFSKAVYDGFIENFPDKSRENISRRSMR